MSVPGRDGCASGPQDSPSAGLQCPLGGLCWSLAPRPGVSSPCGAAGRVGMLEVSIGVVVLKPGQSATICGCLVQRRRG